MQCLVATEGGFKGLLCVQGTPEGVEDNGSLTRVAAFPIGIDPERFARALEKPNVKAHIAQLLNRYAGRKVRRHRRLHPPAQVLPLRCTTCPQPVEAP